MSYFEFREALEKEKKAIKKTFEQSKKVRPFFLRKNF